MLLKRIRSDFKSVFLSTPGRMAGDHSYITSSHFWDFWTPLRQHVFSTKNKQKLAFSDPPLPPYNCWRNIWMVPYQINVLRNHNLSWWLSGFDRNDSPLDGAKWSWFPGSCPRECCKCFQFLCPFPFMVGIFGPIFCDNYSLLHSTKVNWITDHTRINLIFLVLNYVKFRECPLKKYFLRSFDFKFSPAIISHH